jgi:beta-lactamase regulating signal transducer with metallopeptidase domain
VSGALAQVALNDLLFAAVLAGIASVVHRAGRYPAIAHALWVLVLVKAITPPFVVLPLVPGPADPSPTGASADAVGAVVAGDPVLPVAPAVDASSGFVDPATALAIIWLLGSVVVLAVSIARIRRFDRLLRRTSRPAPPPVLRIASELARTLGLRSVPAIELSTARISPMTWWTGRRVRVVIPSALADDLDLGQLRLVLAHELAHVRRRDHVVRWLEWLARVVAWWNPVVWLAQRRLREAEELSCDALVLDRLAPGRRSYAHALLAVVEFLARPATRRSVFATGMGEGANLERRFRRIVADPTDRLPPLWLRAGLGMATVAISVLGIGAVGPAIGPDRAGPVSSDPMVLTTAAAEPIADDGSSFVSGHLTDPIPVRGGQWDGRLVGTDGRDTLSGRQGRDHIDGRGGPDELAGGGGSDRIVGGPGRDAIRSGPGDDVVVTWQDGQRDTVDCGPGAHDRAIADWSDALIDCEVVARRDPLA